MTTYLIRNVQVVSDGRIFPAEVLVREGRIERIAGEISAHPDSVIVDGGGRHLLPGLIDDQVHFREPGLTHKGDIATESAAAVAGGTTSFLDMPNVRPPTVTRKLLADKYQRAQGRARANFGFYMGATNENLDEITELTPDEACGVKVFMGASTGNMLVDDPGTLTGIFAKCPVPIATHCEDTPTIKINEQRYRDRYGEDVPMEMHPLIRSAEACYQSTALAVDLARQQDARLHVLHLSTAREIKLFSNQALEHKRITCEACVPHVWFDESEYSSKGTLIKCNPAIKTAADRQGLIFGLNENYIDIIATDHAPHTLEEKQQGYFQAPSGMPMVQHSLLALLDQYHWGRLDLETVVTKACHNPARIFGIQNRGYIREGFWADLVLVDLACKHPVTADNILYKCGWSPFTGHTFQSSVITTWVNGVIAYHDGQLTRAVPGQRLSFDNFEAR